MHANTARLLITCEDASGIIAAVAGFIAQHEGNILDADQHSDREANKFFMRVEIDLNGFRLDEGSFEAAWRPVSERFGMKWEMHWGNRIKRMAVMVTKTGHCLSDLLWRWRTGELRVDLPIVIGNHPDLEPDVRAFGVQFHCVPVRDGNKAGQEAAILALLAEYKIDFVVLARYMRILTPDFVAAYPQRIINIHHSFLPAFAGARPYHQAHARGVKIIGATSHYVTVDLDQGPIIAQEALDVGHRDSVEDLIRKGRDLERVVLARAVHHHVEDEILVSGNKTVVFA